MSNSRGEVKVSVNEVNTLSQKLDDLKEFFDFRLKAVEEKVDGKCNNCPTSVAFKERSRSQWTHIKALWAVVGTAITMVIGYLYHLK
jgi:hypothetical protein